MTRPQSQGISDTGHREMRSSESSACEAYDCLFKAILLDPNHVLQKHFPETRPTNYNLRPRAHGFKLPLKDDWNYVPRSDIPVLEIIPNFYSNSVLWVQFQF